MNKPFSELVQVAGRNEAGDLLLSVPVDIEQELLERLESEAA